MERRAEIDSSEYLNISFMTSNKPVFRNGYHQTVLWKRSLIISKMYKIIAFALLLSACDNRVIRKATGSYHVSIYWCIKTSEKKSSDYVEVKYRRELPESALHPDPKIIFEAKDAIVDVKILTDTISIKVVKSFRIQDATRLEREAFGHPVRIDTTGTKRDLRMRPAGIERCVY
jgi:hypothetical protein